MASRYQIVCMVVDCGSLKRAADELGYTQSAVSQAVKALERELGTTLIERGKQGVSLTRDGKQYLPYLRQIVTAEAELEGKRQELLRTDAYVGKNGCSTDKHEGDGMTPETTFATREEWVGFLRQEGQEGLRVRVMEQVALLDTSPSRSPKP